MTYTDYMSKVKTIDVSGFEQPPQAKGYERVCQQALWLGIQYLAKCDRPQDILAKTSGFKYVYGICETPESAKELETIWSKWDKEVWHGWTGAQHQAVVGHLFQIAKHGLTWWLDQFKDEPNRIYEVDLEELLKK